MMLRLLDRTTPRWVRHDPDRPFTFTLPLNLLFAFCTTFTVANLYYSQPNLNALAVAFGVSSGRVGQVPTLSQAGYATGLLLISPVGDLVRRRPLILGLVGTSTVVTVGMATVRSYAGFEALNFLMGVATVTPQVLMPLVGDLAPAARRGQAVSLVLSGLLLGILSARVIAGVCQSTTGEYRVTYYFSVAVQAAILVLLFLFLPDYPAKTGHGLSYLGIIRSTVAMMGRYPTLVQSCLVGGLMSAGFLNFWVTLTFLLGGSPFAYTALEIGLFGLLGLVGVGLAPLAGRVVDRLVPWYAMVLGIGVAATGQLVGYRSPSSLAAVTLQVVLLDVGQSTQQVSNQARIYALEPGARSRINACYIISLFLGQTMGSGVGTRLYTRHGWWASQSFAVACVLGAFCISCVRGPWQGEESWAGWSKGSSFRREETVPGHPAETKAGSDVEAGVGHDTHDHEGHESTPTELSPTGSSTQTPVQDDGAIHETKRKDCM
ncbi:protein of unknown function [Taphrina deformans PYCC 5710]|uniref:Major facilitator superfamily (MFS) profile domain-containing protein n=1 Tax=Taphrina deformans (strain PYCC 5710 / ATCC 11124 / CBS 356.35 / IMI 108563 / JCM 9778 / NBRC 8474) TaxID=1097556 RepID=R4XEK9_TAPDE|nr:protein of unknown function [Taphrina deformans PYCC 5710]|eukprot:CCG84206.1 protein of unknown function [Taphrina deformans PYCC 5710]